jgi:hypothetical protein
VTDAGAPSACRIETRATLYESDGAVRLPTVTYLEDRGLLVFTEDERSGRPPRLMALPTDTNGLATGPALRIRPGDGGTLRSTLSEGFALLARNPGGELVLAFLDERGELAQEPQELTGLRAPSRQPGFAIGPDVVSLAAEQMGFTFTLTSTLEGGEELVGTPIEGGSPWIELAPGARDTVQVSSVIGPDVVVVDVDSGGMLLEQRTVELGGEVFSARTVASPEERVLAMTLATEAGPAIAIERAGRRRTRPVGVPLRHVAAAERSGWVLAAGAAPGVIQLFATDMETDSAMELTNVSDDPTPAVVAIGPERFLVVWASAGASSLRSATVRCE